MPFCMIFHVFCYFSRLKNRQSQLYCFFDVWHQPVFFIQGTNLFSGWKESFRKFFSLKMITLKKHNVMVEQLGILIRLSPEIRNKWGSLVEDTSAIYLHISGVGFQLSSHPESEICAPLLKPNNVRYLGNIGASAKLVVMSVSSTILPPPKCFAHSLGNSSTSEWALHFYLPPHHHFSTKHHKLKL